jgi:succinate dehydrogenase / fumarate reductase cytochrome b subunit
MRPSPTFYQTPIGKEFVMAVSGAILYLYILGHLAGKLQIYGGRDTLNNCARTPRCAALPVVGGTHSPVAAVGVHIVTSIQLWWLHKHVRPIGYVRKKDVPPAYAAGTMVWSGPIVALFVIFHVLHLTTGSVGLPFRELDAYGNLVGGFRIGWVAALYVIAMIFLARHLYDGFWSLFQSLGVSHPQVNHKLKYVAHLLANPIGAGFISIPTMVLIGAIR